MKVTHATLIHELYNLAQKNPLLIVMVGAPASGKSTFIQALSEVMHFAIASTDDQIDAYAKLNNLTYSEAFKRCNFKTMKRFMEETALSAVKDGRNVVSDQTNMTRKSRSVKLAWAGPGYLKVGVDFEVDDKVLLERLAARAKATGKDIPKGIVFSMLKDHQAPTRDEGFDYVFTLNNTPNR